MRPLGAPVPSERVVEMHNSTFAKAAAKETKLPYVCDVEAARWTRSNRLWGARHALLSAIRCLRVCIQPARLRPARSIRTRKTKSERAADAQEMLRAVVVRQR